MDRWVGGVAVVTGASVGIGADIAKTLTIHGMKVVACARDISPILSVSKDLETAPGVLQAVKCDVRREEDVKHLFQSTIELFGRLDVVINNAGVGHSAPILSGDTDRWRDMMEVNILGPAMVTREAVKCFQNCQIKEGHIINVNGIYGLCGTANPNLTFYAATKSALRALTEGSRHEMQQLGLGIRVSQISPGLVGTEFIERYRNIPHGEAVSEVFSKNPHLQTKDVVSGIVYILTAPKHVQVRDVILSATSEANDVIC